MQSLVAALIIGVAIKKRGYMLKKLLVLAITVLAFLCWGVSSATASDWPAVNQSAANNNYISDPSILNAQPEAPKSLDVPYNSMGQIIAEGKLFFSDGLALSTIYAYSLPTLDLVWSKQLNAQVTNIVYSSGNIYLGTGSVYSMSASTGEINWSVPVTTGYKAKILQVNAGVVYAVRWNNNINYLLAMRQDDGQTLGSPTNVMIDSINDIVLTSNTIVLTAVRYNAGGASLVAFDKNNYQYLGTSTTCRSSSATTYDAEQGIVYITATDGALCAYEASSLTPIFPGRMFAMSRLVKYGEIMYSVYGRNIQYFSAKDRAAVVSNYANVLDSSSAFSGHPIVVNGVMFANTNKGQLMSKNLESGELKFYDIDSTMLLQRVVYGSGHFVLTGANNGKKKFYVYNYANLGAKAAIGELTIISPYHIDGNNQYLGQLHAHVETETQLDWTKTFKTPPTAWDVESRYKNAGYDFVALTEHNKILPNPAVTGLLHIENSEEDTQAEGGNHILALGTHDLIDETKSDQERIDSVVAQGGVPVLAHPNSYRYGISSSGLLSINSILHSVPLIEIFNNAIDNAGKYIGGYDLSGYKEKPYALDKMDLMNSLVRVFATASDDYTPYDGGFDGGAVVVFSPDNSQQNIMSNIKTGNFYAVQGSKAPRIQNIIVNQSGFSVVLSELSNISFIGKGGQVLKHETNVQTSAYIFTGDEIYVRAEIEAVDSGLKAWTQAVMITPSQNNTTITAGEHTTMLYQAAISSNTSSPVDAKILDGSDYPKALPPLGYLSPVYQFSTEGEVLQGNRLAISYANRQLPVNASNLAIFTFDESQQRWIKAPSTVDQTNKIVITELPHYSLYALSAELLSDTEPPQVALLSPSNLNGLAGVINLWASASDNQAVTAVRFLLDNQEIASDIVASDGWSAELDTSKIVSGNHKLKLIAEDFYGNTAEQEYDIVIAGGIAPPSIDISTPNNNDYVNQASKIIGSYTSQLAIESIKIFLDNVFINDADVDIAGGTYQKTVDWQSIVEGSHVLRVELFDIAGNRAECEKTINIGQEISAKIISPQSAEYMRGGGLPVEVVVTPTSSAVAILLDGKDVANNQTIDISEYAFGSHILEVKYQGKILASTTFYVGTDYDDTLRLISRLYAEGRIKNSGITNSIIVRLRLAKLADSLHLYEVESTILNDLLDFVSKHGRQKKPLIDEIGYTIISENIKFIYNSNIYK